MLVTGDMASIEWEKRNQGDGALLGLATFTVGTGGSNGDGLGPFACQDTNNTGTDDNNPITVVDNGANDADADAGQIKLDSVCPGTFTITETVPPAGSTADPDNNRAVTVATGEAAVIGTQGTADDCPDSVPATDSDEADFCNALGTLSITKSADVARVAHGGTVTYTFSVT